VRNIGPLAAGIRGAEGGTVEIYQRGTFTRALLYTDFEAKNPTCYSPVVLDAYGRAAIYVNEVVDVAVSDYSGTALLGWTEGDAAPAIEVISSHFTGEDYETGETGISKPTDLLTVLESLDTVTDALGAAYAGPFFDVKDPAYGALGNGTHDDGPHIALAVAAAVAAGGGVVWFPAGTYRLTTGSGIVLDGTVSLLGAGSGCVTIIADAAIGTNVISVTLGADDVACFIRGLDVEAAATLAHYAIHVVGSTTAGHCVVEQCSLNTLDHLSGGIYASGSDTVLVTVRDCLFTGGTHQCVDGYRGATSPTVVVSGCRVRHSGATLSVDDMWLGRGVVRDCVFDNSSLVTATGWANVRAGSAATGPITVVGNTFGAPGGATGMYAIHGFASVVVESGNYVSWGLEVILHIGAADTTHRQKVGQGGYHTQACPGASATCYVYPQVFGTEHVTTNGYSFTASLAAAPPGTPFVLVVENTHGATTVTVTVAGGAGALTCIPFDVGPGMLETRVYHSILANGSYGWTIGAQSGGDVARP
jgi:hypothetical protein